MRKFFQDLSPQRSWALAAVCTAALMFVYFVFETRAIVGWSRITRTEVNYRNQVNRLYNPDDKRDLGLQNLIRAHVRYQVLKQNKIYISEEDLRADARRMDMQTQDPIKLKKIKDLFGSHERAYLDVFIFPALVEQKIFSLANYGNTVISQESYDQAKAFIASFETAPTLDFVERAKAAGGQIREMSLSNTKGMLWKNPDEKQNFKTRRTPTQLQRSLDFERLYFKDMKPHQVTTEPLDFDDVWFVPLLLKREKKLKETFYTFQVAVFMKQDPSAWLEKESQKIRVFQF